MEINAEIIALMVVVFTALKLSLLAVNRLLALVIKDKNNTSAEKREERLANMEEKLAHVDDKTIVQNEKIGNLEKSLQELHDCVDRMQVKNEQAHQAATMRLDSIHEVSSRLDGKMDIIQNLIQGMVEKRA